MENFDLIILAIFLDMFALTYMCLIFFPIIYQVLYMILMIALVILIHQGEKNK